MSLWLVAVALLAGCGADEQVLPERAMPTEQTNEAPPWAELPDGEMVAGPEFRGWTEWPFQSHFDETRSDLRISQFETEDRLVFLNVMSCVPHSDFTRAYGWGLVDADGELLNAGYTTLILDWLEAPYQQPAEGSCGEGWLGVPIDPQAEPVAVIWADVWDDRQQTWPLGSAVSPEAIAPVADDLTLARFGDEAEASGGSYWTVLGLVQVPVATSQTPPPPGTDWWVAEAQYCPAAGDDRIWDGLQLGVDGWYVFNPSGREIALDPTHPPQPAIPAGECGFIWETFALPQGLEPSHVRLRTNLSATIWVR